MTSKLLVIQKNKSNFPMHFVQMGKRATRSGARPIWPNVQRYYLKEMPNI